MMGRHLPSCLSKTLSIYSSSLLIALIYTASSAPVQQQSAVRSPREKGCYYLSTHYENGEKIETNEPCLNCTCANSALMCYLRICPFVKPVGEDCIVERNDQDCCPKIWCPEVVPSNCSDPAHGPHDLGAPGCYLDGHYYEDGAQLPRDPRRPCEVCYCIRNSTSCVMQECELKVQGCTPVYRDGQCCPCRYNCTYEETTTAPPGITLDVLSEGCVTDESVLVADGEAVNSSNPCEHCYCMRNEIVCAIQECQAPNEQCRPLPPKPGHCCPDKYDCPVSPTDSTTIVIKPVTTKMTTLRFATVFSTEPDRSSPAAPEMDTFSVFSIPEQFASQDSTAEEFFSTTKLPEPTSDATSSLVKTTKTMPTSSSILQKQSSTEKSLDETYTYSPTDDEYIEKTSTEPVLIPIPGEGECRVDGAVYQNGQNISSADPCKNSCQCINSVVQCKEITCHPSPYENVVHCKVIENYGECCPIYDCSADDQKIQTERTSVPAEETEKSTIQVWEEEVSTTATAIKDATEIDDYRAESVITSVSEVNVVKTLSQENDAEKFAGPGSVAGEAERSTVHEESTSLQTMRSTLIDDAQQPIDSTEMSLDNSDRTVDASKQGEITTAPPDYAKKTTTTQTEHDISTTGGKITRISEPDAFNRETTTVRSIDEQTTTPFSVVTEIDGLPSAFGKTTMHVRELVRETTEALSQTDFAQSIEHAADDRLTTIVRTTDEESQTLFPVAISDSSYAISVEASTSSVHADVTKFQATTGQTDVESAEPQTSVFISTTVTSGSTKSSADAEDYYTKIRIDSSTTESSRHTEDSQTLAEDNEISQSEQPGNVKSSTDKAEEIGSESASTPTGSEQPSEENYTASVTEISLIPTEIDSIDSKIPSVSAENIPTSSGETETQDGKTLNENSNVSPSTTYKDPISQSVSPSSIISKVKSSTSVPDVDITKHQVFTTGEGCTFDGKVYKDGETVEGTHRCEHCFCSAGQIACSEIVCKSVLPGCVALPSEDESKCCPDETICEKADGTTIRLPVTSTTQTYAPSKTHSTTAERDRDADEYATSFSVFSTIYPTQKGDSETSVLNEQTTRAPSAKDQLTVSPSISFESTQDEEKLETTDATEKFILPMTTTKPEIADFETTTEIFITSDTSSEEASVSPEIFGTTDIKILDNDAATASTVQTTDTHLSRESSSHPPDIKEETMLDSVSDSSRDQTRTTYRQHSVDETKEATYSLKQTTDSLSTSEASSHPPDIKEETEQILVTSSLSDQFETTRHQEVKEAETTAFDFSEHIASRRTTVRVTTALQTEATEKDIAITVPTESTEQPETSEVASRIVTEFTPPSHPEELKITSSTKEVEQVIHSLTTALSTDTELTQFEQETETEQLPQKVTEITTDKGMDSTIVSTVMVTEKSSATDLDEHETEVKHSVTAEGTDLSPTRTTAQTSVEKQTTSDEATSVTEGTFSSRIVSQLPEIVATATAVATAVEEFEFTTRNEADESQNNHSHQYSETEQVATSTADSTESSEVEPETGASTSDGLIGTELAEKFSEVSQSVDFEKTFSTSNQKGAATGSTASYSTEKLEEDDSSFESKASTIETTFLKENMKTIRPEDQEASSIKSVADVDLTNRGKTSETEGGYTSAITNSFESTEKQFVTTTASQSNNTEPATPNVISKETSSKEWQLKASTTELVQQEEELDTISDSFITTETTSYSISPKFTATSSPTGASESATEMASVTSTDDQPIHLRPFSEISSVDDGDEKLLHTTVQQTDKQTTSSTAAAAAAVTGEWQTSVEEKPITTTLRETESVAGVVVTTSGTVRSTSSNSTEIYNDTSNFTIASINVEVQDDEDRRKVGQTSLIEDENKTEGETIENITDQASSPFYLEKSTAPAQFSESSVDLTSNEQTGFQEILESLSSVKSSLPSSTASSFEGSSFGVEEMNPAVTFTATNLILEGANDSAELSTLPGEEQIALIHKTDAALKTTDVSHKTTGSDILEVEISKETDNPFKYPERVITTKDLPSISRTRGTTEDNLSSITSQGIVTESSHTFPESLSDSSTAYTTLQDANHEAQTKHTIPGISQTSGSFDTSVHTSSFETTTGEISAGQVSKQTGSKEIVTEKATTVLPTVQSFVYTSFSASEAATERYSALDEFATSSEAFTDEDNAATAQEKASTHAVEAASVGLALSKQDTEKPPSEMTTLFAESSSTPVTDSAASYQQRSTYQDLTQETDGAYSIFQDTYPTGSETMLDTSSSAKTTSKDHLQSVQQTLDESISTSEKLLSSDDFTFTTSDIGTQVTERLRDEDDSSVVAETSDKEAPTTKVAESFSPTDLTGQTSVISTVTSQSFRPEYFEQTVKITEKSQGSTIDSSKVSDFLTTSIPRSSSPAFTVESELTTEKLLELLNDNQTIGSTIVTVISSQDPQTSSESSSNLDVSSALTKTESATEFSRVAAQKGTDSPVAVEKSTRTQQHSYHSTRPSTQTSHRSTPEIIHRPQEIIPTSKTDFTSSPSESTTLSVGNATIERESETPYHTTILQDVTDAGPQYPEEGYCFFEGQVFHSAEQIPRSDPCEFCFCFRSDIICLQQTCPPPIKGCYATPIRGFCCPRFQCPVQESHLNVSTTTTTTKRPRSGQSTTTTSVPVTGCEIDGAFYRVGQVVRPASGPCIECKCEFGGMMKCDPQDCQPQAPLLLRMNREFFSRR